MSIDTILAAFGQRAGMGALRRNNNGVCRLVFDAEYIVDIEAPDGGASAYLSCVVGPADAELGSPFMRRLLAANLMGRDSGGAAFALDEEAGEVVLCRVLPLDGLTGETLEAALDGVVDAAQRWRAEIDALDPEAPAAIPEAMASDEPPETGPRLWL